MISDLKVWFVTGCSSGFGLCVTQYALQKGDRVVATLRKPEVLSELAARYPDRLLVLKLDVIEAAEVTAAFAAGLEQFGRIDVVVNNAGFGIISEVEGTNDENARALFEVNFWGASRVSREAVRFFREENRPMGGRLLQVSSMSGIRSGAGTVYYSASKFGMPFYVSGATISRQLTYWLWSALEALSEGLAEELDPDWNIKVTILEPGPFLTKCATVNLIKDPVHPAYASVSSATMKKRALFENPIPIFDGDPEKFARAVYKVAYLEDPPLRLPIHSSALFVLRQKGKQLVEAADKWESWSEDVLIKG